MSQNNVNPLFTNERRSSETDTSCCTTVTEFSTIPIPDSQCAQPGDSEIVEWLDHKEVSHNCNKDGFVSQNNAFREFPSENKEARAHRKEGKESLPATSQKQFTVAPFVPITILQNGKLHLSAGDNEKFAEPRFVTMQTSVCKDSEDNQSHLSSVLLTCSSSLPSLAPSTSSPNEGETLESSTLATESPLVSQSLPSLIKEDYHSEDNQPLHFAAPINENFSSLLLPNLPPLSHSSLFNLSGAELVSTDPLQSPPAPSLTNCIDPSPLPSPPSFPTLRPPPISSMPHPSVREDPPSLCSAPSCHPCPLCSQNSSYGSLCQHHMSVRNELAPHLHPPSPPPQPPPFPPPLHCRDSSTCKYSPHRPPSQSSPSKSPSPATPPHLPLAQSIHLRLSSTFPSSNNANSHLFSLPHKEACQAPPLPLGTPFSKKQSASELLAFYLPPLPPIKLVSPTKPLSTTALKPSLFTTRKCELAPLSSHLAFSPSMEFQHSVKEPMTRCLSSSPSHPVKMSDTSNFTIVEISTPSNASFYCVGSPPPSGGTIPTAPSPSTPCPFLIENTSPPPPPPLLPPPIRYISALAEGCKGLPTLPTPLLGTYGQGSATTSHGQTPSTQLPPYLPFKKSFEAPPPPPPPPPPHASPQASTPIFRGVPEVPYLPGKLAGAPNPPPLPTFGGALLPPPSPLSEGYKVTRTLSLPHGGLGEVSPLHPPPKGYVGPPSPPLPFPLRSGEVPFNPHFPCGQGGAPPPPPPPAPKGALMFPSDTCAAPLLTPSSGLRGPPPLFGGRGFGFARTGVSATAIKKSSLKPLHWVKVTRAMHGSLWAELQKHADVHNTTEFDISELETLFSAVVKKTDCSKSGGRKSVTKSDKVHLIDLRRANNTEIMLTKIKMPLPDMMNALLALDDSILDSDQVENLIKFCPTKEDMELLKNYTGDKESLGKCEQFFLELMKVPRVEAKLRVFCFKIQFNAQTADIRKSLYTVDSACEEIRNSKKLKEIMKKILYLGNILNQGTARGAAIGFRLDSLLKLTDTRAINNKTTLMHYLCKVFYSRSPHLMDFHEDFISLEAASKIHLKALAEEQQGVVKGLEKVEMELLASESDGVVSEVFCKTLKDFTLVARAEVRSLTALYIAVEKNADGLALYFGEDLARCPFEHVITILLNFIRMFRSAHEENCKLDELEKKKSPERG